MAPGRPCPNQARQAQWRDTLNRFWTHYLFGVDNGAAAMPKVIVERENNEWVEYPDWPVPGAAATKLTLTPALGIGAEAGSNGIGRLGGAASSASATQHESFVDDASMEAADLTVAVESPHRLIYQTLPLSAPVHVSGIPEVSLRLSFSAPAAIVTAMLIDYKAAGAPFIVTRGWADPQNRESIERTLAIVPERPYTIAFELQPHDYIFLPGSRIGLMVLSSDRLFTRHPPAGTKITLQPADSALGLPIVGGSQMLAKASR